MSARPRILILGGGFAALETAFLLRMRLHDAAEIALVSDRDHFTFRPNTVYIPFGADPDSLRIDLATPFARRDIHAELGRAVAVDPNAHRVTLANGRELSYDELVIATGAGMSPEEVPGLAEHAETIWTPDSMSDLGVRFRRLRDAARAGDPQRASSSSCRRTTSAPARCTRSSSCSRPGCAGTTPAIRST